MDEVDLAMFNGGAIPPGLGTRIILERTRLSLSLAALAASGGVDEEKQRAYEDDAALPSYSYLVKVTSAGVNLPYLFLGRYCHPRHLTQDEQSHVDEVAAKVLNTYATTLPAAPSGDEERFLFLMLQTTLASLPQ